MGSQMSNAKEIHTAVISVAAAVTRVKWLVEGMSVHCGDYFDVKYDVTGEISELEFAISRLRDVLADADIRVDRRHQED
jgi:hypothetical protein